MPIESRGRKDPALAAAIKAGKMPAAQTMWEYVVGRRPLKVGEETRQPGDPIPEAADWPRLESWLRSGAVVQQPATGHTVTELEDVPGDGVAKTGQSAPADGRPHEAAITGAREAHDDGEPRRSVLRPRQGASE